MNKVVKIIRNENKWGAFSEVFHYYCPCCNIEFSWDRLGDENKYCYNCGNKLDWELYNRKENKSYD